uniref:Uncharacterized protein n=1 Tax=Lactuca sativa TaxID=4236 RepID=A0A9R1X832_LACSA|nr:hypothetical protein LSAT_V11C500263320 [Lactuca sativa]
MSMLLTIVMKGDETIDTYLNCAQEYSDALAAIGARVFYNDLVMLVVSGLRDEENGLKSTITVENVLKPSLSCMLFSSANYNCGNQGRRGSYRGNILMDGVITHINSVGPPTKTLSSTLEIDVALVTYHPNASIVTPPPYATTPQRILLTSHYPCYPSP